MDLCAFRVQESVTSDSLVPGVTMARFFLLLAYYLFGFGHSSLSADVFLLKDGGRIEGELRNPKQSPRITFEVKLVGGGTVSLSADRVNRVITQSDAQIRYEKYLPRMPDTAEGNWIMAKWCHKHQLAELRKKHLRTAIELDPDHEEARRALGFVRIEGDWIDSAEFMKQNGYVRYKGGWRLRQEVEMQVQQENAELATVQWRKKLRMWRGWIGGKRELDALSEIKGIRDRNAANALADILAKENSTDLQFLLIEVLGGLKTGIGTKVFVDGALKDNDSELRIIYLDQLLKYGRQDAIAVFIRALQSKNNRTVNRAAVGLSRLNATSAVLPLIDALSTTHAFIVNTGSGNLSGSFGRGLGGSGTGFSAGGGPKRIKRQLRNRSVHDTLVSLTKQDFDYEEPAWREWYAQHRTPDVLTLRRDK